MEQSGNYMARIPVKSMDVQGEDQGLKIRLTGFSGDSIRTCISYEIDDNPRDFQVQEAFLVDDLGRAYCLVSVERMKKDGELLSWMEFGFIPPDVKELDLQITTLQQSPTSNGFKIKGRTFIDPWDPRQPLSRDQIAKMDCWLGGPCPDREDALADWKLRGSWNFKIPMGKWSFQELDSVTSLDINLSFGKDRIIIKEFRTSNTGAFLLVESRNPALQEIGDHFKSELIRIFDASPNLQQFHESLEKSGISKSYVPVDLTVRIMDQGKMSLYSPDFRDPRGVIGNRIYHFFDDCISGKYLDVVIMEIKNIKPDPPLSIAVNYPDTPREDVHKIDVNLGSLHLQGELVIHDVPLLDGIYQARYSSRMEGAVEYLTISSASLILEREGGETEEIPMLGNETLWDPAQESLARYITFPALSPPDQELPGRLTLMIRALDAKLKKPLVFPFQSVPGVSPYGEE